MPQRLPIEEIATRFDLGVPTSVAEPVAGGASHALFRLQTSRGTWAIKKLTRRQDSWWNEAFERSVRLELAAVSTGLDCPRPLVPSDPVMQVVAEVENVDGELLSVRVHEWAEGPMVSVPAKAALATWLGRTMAQIGRLGVASNETMQEVARTHPLAEWDEWIGQAELKGLAIGARLRASKSLLLDANQAVEGLRQNNRSVLPVVHRDVSPSNVLMSTGGPRLIDWDSAGPDDPWLDVVQSAVRFAGGLNQDLDETSFRSVIGSYRHHGGEVGHGDEAAFSGVIKNDLESLSYFLWKALGHRGGTVEDQLSAEQTANRCLDELRLSMQRIGTWTKVLRGEFSESRTNPLL